jgi:hypothetical protein
MTALENMQRLHDKLESIKPNFAVYIQNKDIPLEERWAIFALAPSELKTHEDYGPTFRSIHSDFIMYDGPVHMDRGQTMTTLDLIEDIESSLKDIEEDMYCGRKWAQDMLEAVDINALKEEIMAKNLHSFDYDW